MVSPKRQRILDISVVMVILIVGWVYTFGIDQVLDIGLYDESDYLHGGLLIPDKFPAAQDAPVYALWYFVLSFFQPDAVQLYFLNYKLMTILPPILLFLTLRAYTVSRILSLVLSVGFLFSTANFPTWPKVGHFAVLVLFSGFLLSSIFQNRTLQTSALVVSVLFLSYVRPEYFLAFIGLCVVLVLVNVRAARFTRSLKSTIPSLLAMLSCVVIILWFGVPTASGNRSMVAFGQSYACNWVRWHNDERNPWTNYTTVVKSDFGDADSFFEALATNPWAVVHHIVHNTMSCPYTVKSMVSTTFPSCYPARIGFRLGILVLAVVGTALIRRKGLTALRKRLAENWAFLWFRLGLLAIILVPGAISVVLIAPRAHYLYLNSCTIVYPRTGSVTRDG